MYHHRMVLSGPFGPYQSNKVQEISGVIRDAVVWPSQVLNLGKFSLLLTLKTQEGKKMTWYYIFMLFREISLLFEALETNQRYSLSTISLTTSVKSWASQVMNNSQISLILTTSSKQVLVFHVGNLLACFIQLCVLGGRRHSALFV